MTNRGRPRLRAALEAEGDSVLDDVSIGDDLTWSHNNSASLRDHSSRTIKRFRYEYGREVWLKTSCGDSTSCFGFCVDACPAVGAPVTKNATRAPVAESLESSVKDRKSTRLNSSHPSISYAVSCLKKKNHPSAEPR